MMKLIGRLSETEGSDRPKPHLMPLVVQDDLAKKANDPTAILNSLLRYGTRQTIGALRVTLIKDHGYDRSFGPTELYCHILLLLCS